ncbi:hypothetical protein [Nonomuraea indica]|uniref:hypothetical protein n=1 Tax=Nonomuraea indica TaxID=1581193 RepID=UPI000C7E33AA|nr:hypothetical protein [Nonomuraea indica]
MLHRRTPRHAPTRLDTRNVRLAASAAIAAVALSVFALARTERGMALLGRGVAFLELYAGVFALMLFTATVGLGLLTTERVFLSPANRVRAQLAHRATAVIGLGYLVTHVVLMMTLSHVPVTAVLLPTAGLWVALGAVSFNLLVMVLVTGVVRGRFAVSGRPWMWRLLHGGAYLAWPVAVLHGLTAGRPAAGWVVWSYAACLAAVGAALLVRVLATLLRPVTLPESVAGPAVSAEPLVRPEEINAPVSLAAARRRYREAG